MSGQLLVVALGAGLARVFFETADQVYLPTLLRPEQVPEGNAKLHATQTASYLVGPGLAGLIAQLAGAVTAATGPPALLIPLAGPGPRVLWHVLGGALVSLGVAVGNVVKASSGRRTPHTPCSGG